MKKLLLLVILSFLLSCTFAARSYAIVHADLDNYVADVQKKLIPLLGNVTLVNVQTTTPSANLLASFDALLVYSNYPFGNPAALGDLLANYVDSGKGVVLSLFSLASGYSLAGRFLGTTLNNTYYIITPSGYASSGELTLLALNTTHPILSGVQKFDGGLYSYRRTGDWTVDADKIAAWSDRTPLIGTRIIKGARRVDLNFYPASSDAYPGFWVSSTDGAKIIANSLIWASASALCPSYTTCGSCASSNCQWCLDSNDCNTPDFICPNRIVKPGDCPAPVCSQLLKCSTCLAGGSSCSWCLDNSTCVIKNTPCKGELNDGKFCSSMSFF